jgi:hypothetical protein
MESVPKVKINPKGSFVSREALESQLRQHRDTEKSIEGAQAAQDESKVEAEKRDRNIKIDEILPETVFSVLDDEVPLPFQTFKAVYRVIWDQVADKTHLARGYCTFDTPINGVSIRLRTLKTFESKALQRLIPSPAMANNNYEEFVVRQSNFRDARVVTGMMSYDGQEMADLGVMLKSKMPLDWLASSEVVERKEFLDTLPEAVTDMIAGTLSDISRAYRLATRENLKNLLAPLLHS